MRKLLVIIEAPGKAVSLKQTLRGLGLEAEVVATAGHFASWPKSLWPLGARIKEGSDSRETSAPYVDEFARILSGERAAAIQAAIAKAVKHNARIIVATDPDPEGEAIALDILMLAADHVIPGRLERLRLTGLDEASVSLALASARPMNWRNAARDAAPARTRALLDRVAGSACSRPGAPAGRVLTAGLSLLKANAVGAPAGEIRLAAAAADGGQIFMSRIEIFAGPNGLFESQAGLASKTVATLAERRDLFARRAPGRVKRLASLSAGAAIRIAGTPCHDACSLVVEAGRAGLSAGRTAAAAQSLYMKGLISYPRTAVTHLPETAIVGVTRLATALGVDAFDPDSSGFLANPENERHDDPGACHHGLHPLFNVSRNRHETAGIVDVIMSPARDSAILPDEDERLVFALVARRAIQAGLPSRLERGAWVRESDASSNWLDNAADVSSDVNESLAEALEDVEWFREIAPRPPWECAAQPGVSLWPLEARVADALIRAKLVRPSTVASHAARIASYAGLDEGFSGFPVLQINESGAHILDAAPSALKSGDFARAIDQLARDAASWPGLAGEISAKGDSRDATRDAIGHMLAWALKRSVEEFQRQGGSPNLFLSPFGPIATDPGEPVPAAFNNAPQLLERVWDDWRVEDGPPQAGSSAARNIGEKEMPASASSAERNDDARDGLASESEIGVEDVRFAALSGGRTAADEDEHKSVDDKIVPEIEKISEEDIDEEEEISDNIKRPAIS